MEKPHKFYIVIRSMNCHQNRWKDGRPVYDRRLFGESHVTGSDLEVQISGVRLGSNFENL